VGEDDACLRVLGAPLVRVVGHLGNTLARVHHHRQPFGIGEREYVVEPRVDHVKTLPARMEFQADGAVVQAALGLPERVVGGVEPCEAPDPPARAPRELAHAPVRSL
jgi:hypothetical protein